MARCMAEDRAQFTYRLTSGRIWLGSAWGSINLLTADLDRLGFENRRKPWKRGRNGCTKSSWPEVTYRWSWDRLNYKLFPLFRCKILCYDWGKTRSKFDRFQFYIATRFARRLGLFQVRAVAKPPARPDSAHFSKTSVGRWVESSTFLTISAFGAPIFNFLQLAIRLTFRNDDVPIICVYNCIMIFLWMSHGLAARNALWLRNYLLQVFRVPETATVLLRYNLMIFDQMFLFSSLLIHCTNVHDPEHVYTSAVHWARAAPRRFIKF